jgi:phosphatidylglycerol:prolipoprotein diacylglycerol transferase
MYPLVRLGPFNLSSGGLLLVLALVLGSTLMERAARRRGGDTLAEQASSVFLPALAGAAVGGRLWYGLLNWDLYGPAPQLFLALRIADLAWPGALLGGLLAGWLWCRWHRFDTAGMADAAALALLPAQALASIGLLLSGEAFGVPTTLPWAVPLFGTTRHPTQLYLTLAALLGYAVLRWLDRRSPTPGTLFVAYLIAQGVTFLLLEPLRADSLLLPYGIRVAQLVGLGFVLAALLWLRGQGTPATAPHGQGDATLSESGG